MSHLDNTELIDQIHSRLAALEPVHISLADQSAKHAHHAGNPDRGAHFALTIASAHFAGKSTLKRHRLVYDALADLLSSRIHALRLKACTPEEFNTLSTTT